MLAFVVRPRLLFGNLGIRCRVIPFLLRSSISVPQCPTRIALLFFSGAMRRKLRIKLFKLLNALFMSNIRRLRMECRVRIAFWFVVRRKWCEVLLTKLFFLLLIFALLSLKMVRQLLLL